jgi:hypothetical protein
MRSYLTLSMVAIVLKILGVLILVGGIVAPIIYRSDIANYITEHGGPGATVGTWVMVFCIVVAVISSLLLVALSQLFEIAIAVEHNTRGTVEQLRGGGGEKSPK